jgi:hypothetical protein
MIVASPESFRSWNVREKEAPSRRARWDGWFRWDLRLDQCRPFCHSNKRPLEFLGLSPKPSKDAH